MQYLRRFALVNSVDFQATESLERQLPRHASRSAVLPTYLKLRPTVTVMSINCSIDPLKRGCPNSVSTFITKMGVAPRRLAPHVVATINLFDGRLASRTILPSLLLHQLVQLQETVTRMLGPVFAKSLLAQFAPNMTASS